MKQVKAFITFQEDSDVVKKGDSCVIELPNFKGYEPDYTEPNREALRTFYSQMGDSYCSVVFDFEIPAVNRGTGETIKGTNMGRYAADLPGM